MGKNQRHRTSASTAFPCFGEIWFPGSETRRAAVIHGTVNGWAVAALEWPDARDVINGSNDACVTEVTDHALVVELPTMGTIEEVPIDKDGMAWFDGGWTLNYERVPSMGEPSTMQMPRGMKTLLRGSRCGGRSRRRQG